MYYSRRKFYHFFNANDYAWLDFGCCYQIHVITNFVCNKPGTLIRDERNMKIASYNLTALLNNPIFFEYEKYFNIISKTVQT